MHVGTAIKARRRKRRYQQQELARAAKLSPSGLSLIEAGRRLPRPETLARLAAALGVQVRTLQIEANKENGPATTPS